MSKTKRFLNKILEQLDSCTYGEVYSSKIIEENCATVQLRSGSRFKILIEELEPSQTAYVDGEEINREEFIKRWEDD
jgi:hypothetical protein